MTALLQMQKIDIETPGARIQRMKDRAGLADKVECRWMKRRLLVVLAGSLAFAGLVSCGHASEQKASYGFDD